jgi:hypothetical protein
MKTTTEKKETTMKMMGKSQASPAEKSQRMTMAMKSTGRRTTTMVMKTIVRIPLLNKETLERDTKMIESLSIIPNN